MAKILAVTVVIFFAVLVQAEESARRLILPNLHKRQYDECPAGTTAVDDTTGTVIVKNKQNLPTRDASSLLDMDAPCVMLNNPNGKRESVVVTFDPPVNIQKIMFRAKYAKMYIVKLNGKKCAKIKPDTIHEWDNIRLTKQKSNVKKLEIIPKYMDMEVGIKRLQICQ